VACTASPLIKTMPLTCQCLVHGASTLFFFFLYDVIVIFPLFLLVTLSCVKSRPWLLGIPTNWAWVVSLFLCNCLWSVCFVSSSPLYPILNNVLQMDTKESVDNGSKVHILLVSFQLQFLHSFPPNLCFTRQVAQQIYPISQGQMWVSHSNILHHFSSPLLKGCTT
jgi:hypothetical protein